MGFVEVFVVEFVDFLVVAFVGIRCRFGVFVFLLSITECCFAFVVSGCESSSCGDGSCCRVGVGMKGGIWMGSDWRNARDFGMRNADLLVMR